MNELNLVSSESSQVGNIEDTIVGLGVFTVDTSDLDEILIGNGFVERLVLHQFWKIDMDGRSETGSHVGWAGGYITEMSIIGEFCFLFDLVGTISESLENLLDVGTGLHGDDSKLILFVNPDEESLGVIVEDTSSLWPLSLESCRLKIFITSLEKEMISDELFLLGLSHSSERIIFTLKVTGHLTKSRGNKSFNLNSLFSGNSGTEWISSKVSGNSNSSGVDHLVLISWEWWAVQFVVIHG